MRLARLPQGLRDEIEASGYFPEFVAATIAQAVGPEEVRASLVHHEATFNRDAIHRHVTVLVLTPTRLVVGHTDDGDAPAAHQALSTVETVPLRQVRSVSLTQVASHADRYARGESSLAEAWLSVGWSTVRRVELEPASCGDPTCDADHGLSGTDMTDDLLVRVSAAVDGAEAVDGLVDFGVALQIAAA